MQIDFSEVLMEMLYIQAQFSGDNLKRRLTVSIYLVEIGPASGDEFAPKEITSALDYQTVANYVQREYLEGTRCRKRIRIHSHDVLKELLAKGFGVCPGGVQCLHRPADAIWNSHLFKVG
ncbi:MAG: hypothetical protein A3C50_01070 [Candidatus Staskawiczbacteria bacterium RIFCSPHIGHO2_02_FULL_43_16]|uniref:Uncharacterized protein n=1 Tax=Candidatus Staskawiczbacteria bacterium RIFCSPHIGHO2_01_FULL_41_41 TaxID=1802203 RepID=A0A1G2HUY7_9BACT|nr:MAG: hypothetical protein A2822_04760 [Candidatus Staskawiczbacteria bacterium RIFCSPHIGHO2_01_FULL_41_41]OGZ68392.1 MAG: hypothetical protein A3C50_01070 [Candidatus Staskawiczbacteria bacterium RIFCSPHIGHO2_02_FULL_43_16]OGZ74190.1 MAG: hypothetical protein A3A12_00145 [Candidatus Staskawiczbacteria bacterium RIFCSPLOWO2_01_FULL_43_17b]